MSEDPAADALGHVVGADDLGVERFVLLPLFLGVLVHANLEQVVADYVVLQLRLARVFDVYTMQFVALDGVMDEFGAGLAQEVDASSVVVLDLVLLDDTIRMQEHNPIIVLRYLVFYYRKIFFAFYNENAFLLSMLNQIVSDHCPSTPFTTKRDIGLNVPQDMVSYDFCRAGLF